MYGCIPPPPPGSTLHVHAYLNTFHTNIDFSYNFFPPPSVYIQTGSESHFIKLRLNFEGLEQLSTWLDENQWITKLLDSTFISILRGVPLQKPTNELSTQAFLALKRLVKLFLKTGRKIDFDRILRRLAESARIFLHTHLECVETLERNLSHE